MKKTLAFTASALATAAAVALSIASPAFAQGAGYDIEAPVANSSLSRAEVEADRNLWLKSGLATYAGNQSADDSVAGYARSAASYRAARNSPAYYAELRRVQGTPGAAMAEGPANATPAQ